MEGGVFQRAGSWMDSTLLNAANHPMGRFVVLFVKGLGSLVVFLGATIFIAGIGAVCGAVLQIVLSAIGIVPHQKSFHIDWWTVGGAAIMAAYWIVFFVYIQARERWDKAHGNWP